MGDGEIVPPEGIPHVSAYLKATAHILPVLFELYEGRMTGWKRLNKQQMELI